MTLDHFDKIIGQGGLLQLYPDPEAALASMEALGLTSCSLSSLRLHDGGGLRKDTQYAALPGTPCAVCRYIRAVFLLCLRIQAELFGTAERICVAEFYECIFYTFSRSAQHIYIPKAIREV